MLEHLNDKFDLPSTDVITAPIMTPIVDGDEAIDADILKARQAITDALAIGASAATELARVASVSESPRAYEVLGQMIKTVSETAKDLADIHKKKADIERKNSGTGKVTNNNVFVGSTQELMQLLRGNRDRTEAV